MNQFLHYLIISSASLTALYIVYFLFLRRDTFFTMNRIYLVSSVLLSLILPLFRFNLSFGETVTPVVIFLQPVLITPDSLYTAAQSHTAWFYTLAVVYFTGVAIFGLRFLLQLIQLALLVKRSGVTRVEGLNLILLERSYSPFSFFNLIFIKKDLAGNERLKAIIDHERVHVRQLHSADLIITEILTIVQWFNPVAWLVQRSVKYVHEFLADEGVLRKGTPRDDYRRLIFDQSLGIEVNNLTNNFNVSILKNRMLMMTKSRSARMAGIKAIFALPALLAVLFFFSAGNISTISAQDSQKEKELKAKQAQTVESTSQGDVYKEVKNPPEYIGGTEEMIRFLVVNITYPEAAKKKGVQGTVYVNFIVEKNGALSNIKVKQGIGSGCDEEALRVVKLMPKWKPGSAEDGKPVRVSFVLPIKFALS